MGKQLKLGLNTGYWAGGPPAGVVEVIVEAERLGFDSVLVLRGVRLGRADPAGVVGQPNRAGPVRHSDRADERSRSRRRPRWRR